MKKSIIALTLIFISSFTMAQSLTNVNVKKIEVKGKADMEIVPDEIYLRIALKEYKNGSKTVSMNTLESGLVKAIKSLGLPEDALRVDNVYGYNWNWKKKKSDEFLATKSFKLKVSNVKMVNNLVNKLDSEGLNSMSIAEVGHSKIEEYKINLKIEALKNAKMKASSLLKSIDEEIDGVIEIQEIDYGNVRNYARNEMMLSAKMDDGDYRSNLEYKNITISAEVRAVFGIK